MALQARGTSAPPGPRGLPQGCKSLVQQGHTTPPAPHAAVPSRPAGQLPLPHGERRHTCAHAGTYVQRFAVTIPAPPSSGSTTGGLQSLLTCQGRAITERAAKNKIPHS